MKQGIFAQSWLPDGMRMPYETIGVRRVTHPVAGVGDVFTDWIA